VLREKALRLIDANFNRAREGLRVCEDIMRFVYDDAKFAKAFKKLRHDCSKVLVTFPVAYRDLVVTRNAKDDVGKMTTIREKKRPNWKDLLTSNMKRAEESLRVLEEASKMVALSQSRKFQSLRFKLYELEKQVLEQF